MASQALCRDSDEVELIGEGPIDGVSFRTYVEKVLLPVLRPGDIVVLDNLGSHRSKAVRQLIRSVGAKLFFLTKYSPDLNPIEQVFAKLKHLLRKASARTVDAVCAAIGHALDAFIRRMRQLPQKFRLSNLMPSGFSMDNPIGGIRRGWSAIRDGYAKLFGGNVTVTVTFYDSSSQGGDDWHLFVGREKGTCETPSATLDFALPNNALVHESKRRLETAPPSRIAQRAGSAGRLSACDLRRSVAAASVRRLAIFTETGHNESDGCGIVEPQLSERLIAVEGD